MNRLARLTLVSAMAILLPYFAANPAFASPGCEDRVSADLAAQGASLTETDVAITQACAALRQETVGAPFEIDNSSLVAVSGSASISGTPRVAYCLLYGIITGPNTAIYGMVGVSAATGAAAFTRIVCSSSPSGLAFNTLAPGSASGGADVTTSPLPPSSPLTAQCVSTYGNWEWIVGSGAPISDSSC